MFIRFVRANLVDGMAAREGFFCAAYEMRKDPALDAHTLARLEELLAWFRENLPKPKRFNKSRSKGAWRRNTAGLSWFKPDAQEALRKSAELAALLNEHGYLVERLKTERAGYVVYEDDFQIVAEPFSDTPI